MIILNNYNILKIKDFQKKAQHIKIELLNKIKR